MQAVILSAGKGTRMGEMTKDFPKVLLEYKNKTLLEWKLEIMPENISEIVVVIGPYGNLIQDKFGESYNGKKIIYITEHESKGTAYAVWKAKDVLKGKFLVMMGDDLYSKESLEKACQFNWSITVKKVERDHEGSRIELDEKGNLIGFLTASQYREKHTDNGFVFTGLYSMDKEIFDYPLVKMKTKEEWGLPQTLLQVLPNKKIEILETDFWKQISEPEDLI